jgi:nitrogen-specific signal transduction histidine kinase
VELSDTTREDRLGPFYQVYVDFILRRVVHDLGNSVSGINSLSDYHLRSGVSDPALQESLTLIRESAEQSRDLLVAVGDLLQPADAEEEVVHVRTLIEEVGKFVTLLLPRSIKLETSGSDQPDAII